MEYCKNCGETLQADQKFCPHCGQKTNTGRINFRFLMHELQHGILHVDKGILFTLKELFTRPGYSIREYLDGKRQSHFKPVLLIVILGGLCGLVKHYLLKKKEDSNTDFTFNDQETKETLTHFGDVEGFLKYLKLVFAWFSDHFAFTVLLLIPVAGLSLYWGFRKFRLNYAEWLVITCFISGQLLVVDFFNIILEGLFHRTLGIFFWLLIAGLILWTIFQLFKGNPKTNLFFRTFWSAILYGIFYVISLVIFAIVVGLIGVAIYGNEKIFQIMN